MNVDNIEIEKGKLSEENHLWNFHNSKTMIKISAIWICRYCPHEYAGVIALA